MNIKGMTEAGEVVLAHRCATHAAIGQLNQECDDHAECGACLAEELFAVREWLKDGRRLLALLLRASRAEDLAAVRAGASTFLAMTRPMFQGEPADPPPANTVLQ